MSRLPSTRRLAAVALLTAVVSTCYGTAAHGVDGAATRGSPAPAAQTGAASTASLFTTYSRTATGAGNFAVAYAFCDPGDVATGGGGTWTGGNRPDNIFVSRPEGSPPTGWATRFNGGDASTRIVAHVLCADISPGLFTTYSRTATGAGSFAAASAFCDPGDVVTGGGGTWTGGTRPVNLFTSGPEGSPLTGWATRFNGGDASTRIGAFVVCADISPGLFTTYSRTATGAGNFAVGFAYCDPGDVAMGGGGTWTAGARPDNIFVSRPEGSPPTGWGTRFNGGDASTRIAAHVVCADV